MAATASANTDALPPNTGKNRLKPRIARDINGDIRDMFLVITSLLAAGAEHMLASNCKRLQ